MFPGVFPRKNWISTFNFSPYYYTHSLSSAWTSHALKKWTMAHVAFDEGENEIRNKILTARRRSSPIVDLVTVYFINPRVNLEYF